MTITARLIFSNSVETQISSIKTQEFAHLNVFSSKWNSELGHIRYLLKVIASDPEVRNALKALHPLNTDVLAIHFRHLAEVSPNIAQLRWLDSGGNERLRVDQTASGIVRVVTASQLQNKSRRYYFQQASKLAPGQIYISPIDTNVENGKVEQPVELMLRTVLRTGAANGMLSGMLIINYRLNPLFNKLRTQPSKPLHFELIDSQGEWLLKPDASLDMLNDLNQPNKAAHRYPLLWQKLNKHDWSAAAVLQTATDNRLSTSLRITYGVSHTEAAPHYFYAISTTTDGFYSKLIDQIKWKIIIPALIIGLTGILVILKMIQGGLLRHQLARQLFNEKVELTRVNERLYHANQRLTQMQEANVELRKLSSLGMIVAGVAHELNTPIGGASVLISSIANHVNTLQQAVKRGLRRTELDEFIRSQIEAVELARSNLVTAKNLITSFKRLAMDRHQTDLSRFDLSEVVRDMEKTSQARLRHSLIDISVNVPDHVFMHSYAGIVSQVLQNLVDNALSHAFDEHDAGRIEIIVTENQAAQTVTIYVNDNGKGIDESVRSRMFEPFETSKPGEGHTGLGMHLVHNWVHQILQGDLQVISEHGKGAQIAIILPTKIREVDDNTQLDEAAK